MKHYLFIYGPLGAGGAERVLIDVLRNFDYTRYAVDLCLMMPGGRLYGEIPQEVKVFSLWKGYTLGYRWSYHVSNKLGIDYFLKRKLRVVEDKYDVVVSFLEGVPLKLHALMNLGGMHVSWVHCDLYQYPYEANQFRRGEELRAYNKMDKVVCVAQDTEKAFRRRFPTCTSQTDVIYNPIDYKKILRMAGEECVDNNKFTIVTSGRLTPPKKLDRVPRLARALKDSGRKGFVFQIIGEGELRTELERQIAELGVEDCVQLMGFHANPFPLVKAADMMFCCSGYEGFCLVICEAMLLGTPVVSTRTSGPIEILDNDRYGLLCDHTDESMFQAVCRMMDNPDLRRRYSEVGRERVRDFFVEHTMESIYQLAE